MKVGRGEVSVRLGVFDVHRDVHDHRELLLMLLLMLEVGGEGEGSGGGWGSEGEVIESVSEARRARWFGRRIRVLLLLLMVLRLRRGRSGRKGRVCVDESGGDGDGRRRRGIVGHWGHETLSIDKSGCYISVSSGDGNVKVQPGYDDDEDTR